MKRNDITVWFDQKSGDAFDFKLYRVCLGAWLEFHSGCHRDAANDSAEETVIVITDVKNVRK